MHGKYDFLLRRLSRGGVPDLEFDSVSEAMADPGPRPGGPGPGA